MSQECFKWLRAGLLQIDCETDVDAPRGQALFVIAGLEAKFSGHHAQPRTSVGRRFEPGSDLKITAEYRHWIGGKGVLFELRLGVSDLLGLQRFLRPGELHGNQKLVGWGITISVETGLQLRLEL